MRRGVGWILTAVLVASLIGWSAPPALALTCGVWRWPVKTLSDPKAGDVHYSPASTSVDHLRSLPAPAGLDSTTPRLPGVEMATYRLKVQLVEAVIEDDRDVHLVIAPTGRRSRTMIVEFPDTTCNGAKQSKKKAAMKAARASFFNACGTIGTSFVTLHGKTTITGVGFFDEIHGQTGVAPNGIELHPALSFAGSCSKG